MWRKCLLEQELKAARLPSPFLAPSLASSLGEDKCRLPFSLLSYPKTLKVIAFSFRSSYFRYIFSYQLLVERLRDYWSSNTALHEKVTAEIVRVMEGSDM